MNNEITESCIEKKFPINQLSILGLQHVLAMYAGAVVVPILVAAGIGLNQEQLAILIAADLFTCGIATLIQVVGIGDFAGIKLPVLLGVSFTSIGPMIAVGQAHGITGIFGSVIAAGLFITIIAPLMGKLLKFFPTVVNGSIVTMIGLSLIPVGINNAAGGLGSSDYGSLKNLGIAVFVMIAILIINKYFKGFLQAISVLLGLILGTVLATFWGMVDFTIVANANWISLVTPFRFGFPTFPLSGVLTMSFVLIVVMIETTGCFLAVGDICKKSLNSQDLVKGYRAEGIAAIMGGIFNCFPYSTFGQNIGLLSLTKVTSRYVLIASGVILVLLGTIPKFAALATIIPAPVLGGATVIMFATVAIGGIQMLQTVDFDNNNNLLVAATSIALGLGVTVVPGILVNIPSSIRMLTGDSGIIVTAVSAILLNIFLNSGTKNSSINQSVEKSA